MSQMLNRHAATIRFAFVVLVTLQLAACGSPQTRAQSYYESGMRLLAAQENEKAAVEFRNALRLKRDLLPAWRGLAQSEEATRHWDGLIPALRAILDLDPKDAATRLKLARLLLAGGATKQSLTVINQASEPDADAGLLALKAAVHYKLKDNDSALREARSALKIEPDNSDALIVLAADRLANNDPNGALELLSSELSNSKAGPRSSTLQGQNIRAIEGLSAARIVAHQFGRPPSERRYVPEAAVQSLHVSAATAGSREGTSDNCRGGRKEFTIRLGSGAIFVPRQRSGGGARGARR